MSIEKGIGVGVTNTETRTSGVSKTEGYSVGAMSGVVYPNSPFFTGINFSYNRSTTENESTSIGGAETHSEQYSYSLSKEQQNSLAMYLENITDQYIKRINQGYNSGYWETSITFATQDKISSDILASAMVGELSKPSDRLLPPPRIYLGNLENKTLFVPKNNSSNSLFPKLLSSYITSEELALISSPPIESISGYEIQRMPTLSLTDTNGRSDIVLGNIADNGNPINENDLYLSKNDLNKHVFICGLTGSGKTTTVKHILKHLVQNEKNIPFLVIESAKRDYRQLLAENIFKGNLNIFTIGDATVSPIRFNPFYIQKGVHPLVHIDYLKAIFNASFSLYGPMPSIVEKCLHNIYIKKGWDLTTGIHPHFIDNKRNYDEARYESEEHFYCFPTLTDLKDEVSNYINTELEYQGEVRDNIRTAIIVRLESLCVGAKGLMFNTYDFFTIEDLLKNNTILEMENLADDDDKAFFLGLILALISEYRQKENPAINPGMERKGLQHFIVVEEAHRLLKNVVTERTTEMMGNPKGKAVEMFCNILSEMRSLGQGVAVVEQIPSKISPDIIKNSNTKIVHRVVAKDDQSLLAGSLGISDQDALYLNRLKTGHALCYKEGMGRPVECVVPNDVDSHAITDDKIKKSIQTLKYKDLHEYKAYQLASLLGEDGKKLVIKFFNSLVTLEFSKLENLIDNAKDEVKSLVNSKNIQYSINEELFPDYFTLQVMVLLNNNLYYPEHPISPNLKTIIYNVISEPTEESYNELINKLNTLWGNSSKQFIEDIIENLTIKYLHQNKLVFNSMEIKGTISSFLLLHDAYIVNRISENIQNKMEKYDRKKY